MENSKVYVIACAEALPGKANKVQEILEGFIGPTHAQDKGCIRYELWVSAGNEAQFSFVEEWESMQDLDEHLQKSHIQNGFKQLDGLLVSEPDVKLCRKLGG
ncbi:MAG: putative quinol monooxygenase [Verrucomicrobiota bacterium]